LSQPLARLLFKQTSNLVIIIDIRRKLTQPLFASTFHPCCCEEILAGELMTVDPGVSLHSEFV
jgi:hypothetical protein